MTLDTFQRFLAGLNEIRDFWREAADGERYRPVPADWWCAITDVEGSTKIVAQDGHAPVNFVAAAGIVAAANAVKPAPMPVSIFTGDGCLILGPPQQQATVAAALAATRAWALREYGITLRVGMVPMADLLARDAPITVLKQRQENADLWHLRGPGVSLSDTLVKRDPTYRIADPETAMEPDFSGLSCRWDPIPAQRGVILTLLVRAMGEDADTIYQQVLAAIAERLSHDQGEILGFDPKLLKGGFPPEKFGLELRAYRGNRLWQGLKLLTKIALYKFIDHYDIRVGWFQPSRYRREMATNTDAHQFLDGLALTIDCCAEDADTLETLLGTLHDQRKLCWGSHRDSAARMTCVNWQPGRHQHFLDSSVGGFWQASIQFKRQLAAWDQPSTSSD